MQTLKLLLSAIFFYLFLINNCFGDILLSPLFTEHMVLQRDKPICFWGKANPGEKVVVTLGSQSLKTKADKDSNWILNLPAQKAGGPHLLKFKGENEIKFSDIFIGEVWIASGQSNMEWKLKQPVKNGQVEISMANFPQIRFIDVKNQTAIKPQKNIDSKGWMVCSSQTAPEFSAVAYFYARELFQKLNVPIGVILSEWGGTPAESWTSQEALAEFPEFKEAIADLPNAEAMASHTDQFKSLLQKFNESLKQHDAGTKGEWWKEVLPESEKDWKPMSIPNYWEKAGLENFDGAVWFRKEFMVSSAFANESEKFLRLSRIDDMDSTWINGVKIGGYRGFDRNRNFPIPKGVLKEGKNVIAIRVIDWAADGGICGDKGEIKIVGNNSESIPLNGEWMYKIGCQVKDLVNIGNEKRLFVMPSTLYNAMIHPLLQLSIKGVIWYQGESNATRAKQYQTLFQAMIKDWRLKFKQGDFPFLFVQLANYMTPDQEPLESTWAELREAQTMALNLPATGMALAIDIGEANDIHPKNKQEVGFRLAQLALSECYGFQINSKCPFFDKIEKVEKGFKVSFTNVNNGLVVKDKYGYIKGFSISGSDKKYYWATARLEGNQVLVFSDKVQDPKFVRYGWANNPEDLNLFNSAGLPVCPFRTDKP